MKKFMLVFALVLVLGNLALAQSEAEALVTCTVENALVLVNVDGDWGVFAAGNSYVITPGGFKDPPGPGEGAGIVVGPVGFEVDGNAGDNVLLTLVLPNAFPQDDGNGALSVANWTFGWNFDNDPAAAFAASGPVSGNTIPLTVGGGGATGVFLGATVTVPPTAFAGGYTGQIIGSAAYTGF